MKRDHSEEEFSCITFLQCMIYALLMEADEIKQLSLLEDGHMCQVLEQVIFYTVEASRDPLRNLHDCMMTSIAYFPATYCAPSSGRAPNSLS